MKLQTCVSPSGEFIVGVHRPRYTAKNLRRDTGIGTLGTLDDGRSVDNRANFPEDDLRVAEADWVYEIPNAFPFRGATYISRYFADRNARHPETIALPPRPRATLAATIRRWAGRTAISDDRMERFYGELPEPILLTLATASDDPEELALLARISGRFVHDPETGLPAGMCFEKTAAGEIRPVIVRYGLFKAVANNPCLPDAYKRIMVLRPGAQGDSAITGDRKNTDPHTHVFEYLRENSYIPWGHYAANMADDAVRYRIAELTPADMAAIRHLYYQRTYVRLAEQLDIPVPEGGDRLDAGRLEDLRRTIRRRIAGLPPESPLTFNAALWGWNFGFDFTPAGYRLHGSHQQIHQQYAMIPARVAPAAGEPPLASYACGDLVAEFIRRYRRETGESFFDCYLAAIANNRRTDGDPQGERSLVVAENEYVILFAPKAQTSQWELQLMPRAPVGNVLEADASTRSAIDHGILTAVKVLSGLGAEMITGIEYSKRFDDPETGQRLLYCFLPRLPQSPGAFSEAQLRWINRHYPEDFAAACRRRLADL